MNDIIKNIEDQINNNILIVYIKGTAENPMCGFSAQVVRILNDLDLKFCYVNVLENEDIRKFLPVYSNWPTFPQLFYKKKLIGGADIVSELYLTNKLKKILTE